jgi:hypothetical protein
MTTAVRRLASAIALALLSGCYHVTLAPPAPVTLIEPLLPAGVVIPPETANAQYDVTSAMAGAANRWTIAIGPAIVDYANAYLPSAFPKGDTATVRVELQHFDVHDFEAHAALRFAVVTPGATLFERTYTEAGKGYAARVVWGGAFAMKSSMRQTTDEALRACFEHFLTDARGLAPGWAATISGAAPSAAAPSAATPTQ